MAIGITVLVVGILIVVIYLLVEVKRLRHKMFAIFLIVMILFTYLSFAAVLNNKDIDYKSASGMATAGKLYFSWLGSIFGNFKTLTANAIGMDWKGDDSSKIEEVKIPFLDK